MVNNITSMAAAIRMLRRELARSSERAAAQRGSTTLMKAAVYREYGPPEVVKVEEVVKPVPLDDDVLVRVVASTVCAGDWRARKADPAPLAWFFNGASRPKNVNILGMEFAGTVDAVGKDVTAFRVGDRVFGANGMAFGAHAEYVCVCADRRITRIPDSVSFEEAAAIPYGAVSALSFLQEAGITVGQHVLIHGASGNVGTVAVQLAKHFGARVTAVCGPTNVELVKSLGADEVIDYTKEDFSDRGPVYDIIHDTVDKSGFWRSMRALKRGGAYVMIGPGLIPIFGGLWAKITGAGTVIGPLGRMGSTTLDFLAELVARGELRPVIGRRFPLAQIVEAHRYAEGGHKRGSVVISIAGVG